MASRRVPYFHILSLLLLVSSLVFFWQCVAHLTSRDYVAAGMLMLIGVSIVTVFPAIVTWLPQTMLSR